MQRPLWAGVRPPKLPLTASETITAPGLRILLEAATYERGGLLYFVSRRKIQSLLDTLAAMFLVRQVDGERAYAG
ncbi:hypothetical protein GCM10028824_07460 [Hymenobacter segetis]